MPDDDAPAPVPPPFDDDRPVAADSDDVVDGVVPPNQVSQDPDAELPQ